MVAEGLSIKRKQKAPLDTVRSGQPLNELTSIQPGQRRYSQIRPTAYRDAGSAGEALKGGVRRLARGILQVKLLDRFVFVALDWVRVGDHPFADLRGTGDRDNLRFSLNPDLRSAGQRFVRRIHYLAGSEDFDLECIIVRLVGFAGKDRLTPSRLRIRFYLVLVDVDYRFHW